MRLLPGVEALHRLGVCRIDVAFQAAFDERLLIGGDGGLLCDALRRCAAMSDRQRHGEVHARHFFIAAHLIRVAQADGRVGQLVGAAALRQQLLHAALLLHHAEFVVVIKDVRLPVSIVVLDGLRDRVRQFFRQLDGGE